MVASSKTLKQPEGSDATCVKYAKSAPQYHGPAREAIASACKTMELELNCSEGGDAAELDDSIALLACASALGGIATLVNGTSYTLIDKANKGRQLVFQNGVPKNVTKEIVDTLKLKARDSIAVTTGNKTIARRELKFTFSKIGAAKKVVPPGEENDDEHVDD